MAEFKNIKGKERELIAQAYPRSSVAEAFRVIRTNLQFTISSNKPVQTIIVTSPGPGEGKTFVLANLAVTIAHMGKKVIAVDTNLRHPQLHEFFKLNNEPGFTNLFLVRGKRAPRAPGIWGVYLPEELPDLEGFIQPTKVEGLRVLTCGSHVPHPTEFLSSPRIPFLIEELKKKADMVLFDSAPVLGVADATIVAHKVDGVILVLEAGHTQPEALVEAKEALSKANTDILGVVLNRVELGRRGGYYHYRYPYYYADEGEGKQPEQRSYFSQIRQGISRLLKRSARK